MSDPYKILGVSNTASGAEIKSAYRKLAKKHHPDLNAGNADRFKEINGAYDVGRSIPPVTRSLAPGFGGVGPAGRAHGMPERAPAVSTSMIWATRMIFSPICSAPVDEVGAVAPVERDPSPNRSAIPTTS
jgi:hypothetical protein